MSESEVLVLLTFPVHLKFVNDLEKDRVYRSWAKSLKEVRVVCTLVSEFPMIIMFQFLRPTYPGMLRQIARNVFNIVSCRPIR